MKVDDGEGHPPGENEEEKSEKQAEEVFSYLQCQKTRINLLSV